MPLVSVIMIFHRDQEFLRPAIASILDQTLRDLELVLVDNGAGVAAESLGKLGADPRVRWVRLPRDDGMEPAANAGMAVATGEYFAMMDSDDVALPHRLERQIAALHADPALGVVSALTRNIDPHDRLLPGGVFTLLRPDELKVYSQYAPSLVNPLSAGRREVFLTLPFRAQFRFTGSFDFCARAAEQWRLAVLPEVLMHYRVYPTQTTWRRFELIEQGRAAINLLAARRRAGRPEHLEKMLPLSDTMSAAEYSWRTAAQMLDEGFVVPAAYLARRSLALERSPAAALKAGRLAVKAWRRAPSHERPKVTAMFLTGPVRALGLHPAK
jgi:glycosyltransferase involved in cell wall biosynthesis